jgi:anti-sigma regulatory factor (Ser/Thr protein kinase)
MIGSMSQRSLEFSSQSENLASVRGFVREFLEGEGIPVGEGELLVLGVDEACSNIIRHAYRDAPGQPISLLCERLGLTLRFRLRDFGAPADLSRFKRRALDEVEPGGLGLHLMERVFDEVLYQPQPLGTELVLVKRLTTF